MRQKVSRKAGWSYLSLWGQPVHLGAVREIYWVSREIHILLRAQCWGYQTSQHGDGTSPALWTRGWTAHSESDISPPAREPWPVRGRKSQEAKRKVDGRRRKMGGNGQESHEENQAWLNSWAHRQAQSSYTANDNEVNTIEQGWMYMCSSRFKRNIPGMSETAARFHIPVTCTPTRTDTTERNHTQFKILGSRLSYTS